MDRIIIAQEGPGLDENLRGAQEVPLAAQGSPGLPSLPIVPPMIHWNSSNQFRKSEPVVVINFLFKSMWLRIRIHGPRGGHIGPYKGPFNGPLPLKA